MGLIIHYFLYFKTFSPNHKFAQVINLCVFFMNYIFNFIICNHSLLNGQHNIFVTETYLDSRICIFWCGNLFWSGACVGSHLAGIKLTPDARSQASCSAGTIPEVHGRNEDRVRITDAAQGDAAGAAPNPARETTCSCHKVGGNGS